LLERLPEVDDSWKGRTEVRPDGWKQSHSLSSMQWRIRAGERRSPALSPLVPRGEREEPVVWAINVRTVARRALRL
jgi:hypothetical protein